MNVGRPKSLAFVPVWLDRSRLLNLHRRHSFAVMTESLKMGCTTIFLGYVTNIGFQCIPSTYTLDYYCTLLTFRQTHGILEHRRALNAVMQKEHALHAAHPHVHERGQLKSGPTHFASNAVCQHFREA